MERGTCDPERRQNMRTEVGSQSPRTNIKPQRRSYVRSRRSHDLFSDRAIYISNFPQPVTLAISTNWHTTDREIDQNTDDDKSTTDSMTTVNAVDDPRYLAEANDKDISDDEIKDNRANDNDDTSTDLSTSDNVLAPEDASDEYDIADIPPLDDAFDRDVGDRNPTNDGEKADGEPVIYNTSTDDEALNFDPNDCTDASSTLNPTMVTLDSRESIITEITALRDRLTQLEAKINSGSHILQGTNPLGKRKQIASIIKEHPIGKGLEAFNASFKSICTNRDIPSHPAALGKLDDDELQNIALVLLSTLQILPAARQLQSKTSGKHIFNDLLTLNAAVVSDDCNFDRIRPLLSSALTEDPDDALLWGHMQRSCRVHSATPIDSILSPTNPIAPQHERLRELI
ncbi:hypothetical protein D7B24_006606 [Verticillium nonalfalfae]|uniref:Uncharacterized protein n=1 Tax=Verticillium nonalfalfae TaxID=1051616 RepID=A0A3M9YCX3_9PEZI|nr:uncharacterized protein D7B24_006606 [Verticillium nonalfalfae]RNJ56960.1 hypothetical protein D7B24_006606 [Verticillium nonalfalfae]